MLSGLRMRPAHYSADVEAAVVADERDAQLVASAGRDPAAVVEGIEVPGGGDAVIPIWPAGAVAGAFEAASAEIGDLGNILHHEKWLWRLLIRRKKLSYSN